MRQIIDDLETKESEYFQNHSYKKCLDSASHTLYTKDINNDIIGDKSLRKTLVSTMAYIRLCDTPY